MIIEVARSFEDFIEPNDPANNCLDTAIITDRSQWTDSTKQKLINIAGRVLKK